MLERVYIVFDDDLDYRGLLYGIFTTRLKAEEIVLELSKKESVVNYAKRLKEEPQLSFIPIEEVAKRLFTIKEMFLDEIDETEIYSE